MVTVFAAVSPTRVWTGVEVRMAGSLSKTGSRQANSHELLKASIMKMSKCIWKGKDADGSQRWVRGISGVPLECTPDNVGITSKLNDPEGLRAAGIGTRDCFWETLVQQPHQNSMPSYCGHQNARALPHCLD